MTILLGASVCSNVQCGRNAYCRDGRCFCNDGYIGDPGHECIEEDGTYRLPFPPPFPDTISHVCMKHAAFGITSMIPALHFGSSFWLMFVVLCFLYLPKTRSMKAVVLTTKVSLTKSTWSVHAIQDCVPANRCLTTLERHLILGGTGGSCVIRPAVGAFNRINYSCV